MYCEECGKRMKCVDSFCEATENVVARKYKCVKCNTYTYTTEMFDKSAKELFSVRNKERYMAKTTCNM